MRAKRIRNTLENEKGQSLVEFALVVPLLLLLVFGIAEFGRAWMTKNILTGAAREAVRLAAVPAPGGGMERFGGDYPRQSDSYLGRNHHNGFRAGRGGHLSVT